MDETMLLRFYTPTGEFKKLDEVGVNTLPEAKAVVLARHPTAKMVCDEPDVGYRFTVNGRNVAFLDL